MPYKDKKELYAAQKRYRQRVKSKTDAIVAEWTTLKERKEIPSDPETEQRLLQRITSITFLESENLRLRSNLEGTQLCLQFLMRQKEHG